MTSRDFCFWLQGHFEISGAAKLDETQTATVKRHLSMVFKHEIDPSLPDPTGELQAIHDGPTPHIPHNLPRLDGGETLVRC